MDYRHTEDYARRMEAAALRGHYLRDEAMREMWHDVARWLRGMWHHFARS